MLHFFKKRSKKEKLEEEFKKLMREWHELSTVNRAASDRKFFEAQQIAERLNRMKNEAA